MKMSTLRLRDLLVMFISALVFLPSGATAKDTPSPTPAPTNPTPSPTNPTPEPTTPMPSAEPTVCPSFAAKAEDYDPCYGYTEACCEDVAITGGCCYWQDRMGCYDGEGDYCCKSYDTTASSSFDCIDTESDTDSYIIADGDASLFVEHGGSSGTAVGSVLNAASLTGAFVMLTLVVVAYAAFVLVKKHQNKKGVSYTWPEDETTPIVTA